MSFRPAPLPASLDGRRRHRFGAAIASILAPAMILSVVGLTATGASAAPGGPITTTATTTTTTTTLPSTTTTTTTPTDSTTTTVPAKTTTTLPDVSPKDSVVTTAPPTPPPGPTTPPAPAPRNVTVYPQEMGNILATIRYLESRGQYEIAPNRGNASGAYQFIASTWANYAGYPHAYLAPPEIQDERAVKDVTKFLAQWNNDVSMIPVMWYYPKASREIALMDIVPVPSAGNKLTVREYQQRWLGVFATISGQPVPKSLSLADAIGRLGVAPEPPERDDDLPSVEFPVLGPANIAAPDCDDEQISDDPEAQQSRADVEAAGLCAEAAPSIVFGVKLQPVRAVVDGVITDVDDNPGSGRPISVTLTDVHGRSYLYEGFNDDNPGTSDGDAPAHLRLTGLAEVGTTVWAGQIIGFMGDTDPLPLGVRAAVPTDASVTIDPDAVAPHIRLTISDLGGTPIEAFGPVLDALFRSGCHTGIGRWSVPARSTTHDAVVIETTDNNRDIDSEWVITTRGQVHATGWAALVGPGTQCAWAPNKAFGPGAAGSTDVPAHWNDGLDLPTSVWIELALANDESFASPLLRF